MLPDGQPELGAFAIYILRPTWVAKEPNEESWLVPVWHHLGESDVPISALGNGFVIFEFDKSPKYSGGEVPAYKLPDDRKIPVNVSDASQARDILAYRRFEYINAFLTALYSGYSTIQKMARTVQEPADPTNYFYATKSEDSWQIYAEIERTFDQPVKRGDILQIETLSHAVDLMQKGAQCFGPSYMRLYSLIYTASYHYARHQFSSAQVIGWSVVEALQNHIWKEYLGGVSENKGGHTKINSQRFRILNGREFSASNISQALSLANKIDDDILERLDESRRKRNKLAHDLDEVTSQDAVKVIRLATDLLTEILGTRVTSQLGLSFWL